MAGYGSDDGAANNGFGRRSLHQWEGRLPGARKSGGIPIPPPPVGAALNAAIDEVLEGMSDEQRAEPRF
jgi:hypothetical protein